MRTINIHEAKTHLSKLVEQAAAGEPFIIAKAGRPVVRVVPLDTPHPAQQRRLGFLQGQLEVPDDFDSMGADAVAALFEGEP
jgi:prevent-host-death family protein